MVIGVEVVVVESDTGSVIGSINSSSGYQGRKEKMDTALERSTSGREQEW